MCAMCATLKVQSSCLRAMTFFYTCSNFHNPLCACNSRMKARHDSNQISTTCQTLQSFAFLP